MHRLAKEANAAYGRREVPQDLIFIAGLLLYMRNERNKARVAPGAVAAWLGDARRTRRRGY